MGGSSKKSSGTTVYYGKAAYVMGMGQLTLLHRILVDDTVVWRSTNGLAITGYYVSVDTDAGTCRVYGGKWDQPRDTLLSGHPAYRGQVVVVWTKLRIGSSCDRLPSMSIEGTFAPWNSSTEGVVSPVSVCRELATDERIGLGMVSSAFPEDAVLEAGTKMCAPRLDDAKSAKDIFEAYLELIFAVPRWENRAVQVLRRWDPPDWDAVPHVTQTDILEWPEETTETTGEVCTELHLRWTRLFDDSESDDREDDDSCEQETASVWREPELPDLGGKKVSYDATDIITETAATELAGARGHYEAVPYSSGKVSVFKAKGLLIEPGDAFLLDDIDGQTRRVWCTEQEIEYTKDKVQLTYECDRTSAIHDAFQLSSFEPPSSVPIVPVDPVAVMVFEAPRPLDTTGCALCVCCARGNDVANAFGISVAWGGSDYVYAQAETSFSVYGTLQSAITSTANHFILENVPRDADSLDSVSAAQAAADSLLAVIGTVSGYELVSVQTVTVDSPSQVSLTGCLRNRMGTAEQTWPAGTPVHLIGRAQLPVVTTNVYEPTTIVNTALNPSGGTAYTVKVPQAAGSRVQDIGDCDEYGVTVVGAYSRPLPPESVAATSGTVYTSADMTFDVAVPLWRDEGYASADFYEDADVQIVPVLIIDGVRHVLAPRAAGSVTLTSSEIAAALGSVITGAFTAEFFSFVKDRHSRVGTSVQILTSFAVTYDGEPVTYNGEVVYYNGD